MIVGTFGATGAPPTLSIGAKGAAVVALQKALIDAGMADHLAGMMHTPLQPIDKSQEAQAARGMLSTLNSDQLYAKLADGVFGPNTKNAVSGFQEGHLCSAVGGCGTGIADAKTWAALAAFRQVLLDEVAGTVVGADGTTITATKPMTFPAPPPPAPTSGGAVIVDTNTGQKTPVQIETQSPFPMGMVVAIAGVALIGVALTMKSPSQRAMSGYSKKHRKSRHAARRIKRSARR